MPQRITFGPEVYSLNIDIPLCSSRHLRAKPTETLLKNFQHYSEVYRIMANKEYQAKYKRNVFPEDAPF